MPYFSYDYKLRVYRNGNYIVFDTDQFNLQFDGDQLIKFRNSHRNYCGICGFTRDKNADEKSELNKINQLYMRPDQQGNCLR